MDNRTTERSSADKAKQRDSFVGEAPARPCMSNVHKASEFYSQ